VAGPLRRTGPLNSEGRARVGAGARESHSPEVGPGYYPWKFWKFYMPNRAFGGNSCAIIGPQNGPILLC